MTSTHALHSIGAIRRIEEQALSSLPPGTLMQRAGRAVADLALQLLDDTKTPHKVLVLAGPGNNGGDAFEAAQLLARRQIEVHVWTIADINRLGSDARACYERAAKAKIGWIDASDIPLLSSTNWSLIIDGLFGIGLTRAISEPTASVVRTIRSFNGPVLAIDVPSGLDAETGMIVGGKEACSVRASHTLTFIGDKPGLHTADGRDYAGQVQVDDLGLEHNVNTSMQLITPHDFLSALPVRRENSHKGTFGDVAIVGGSSGMVGAALLSARAAAHCGAGRIFIVTSADIDVDTHYPELMFPQPQALEPNNKTIVAGPGLGTSRTAHDTLARVLSSNAQLVVDADALNLLAEEPQLQGRLSSSSALPILTPHPLEAARLLNTDTLSVQTDRIAAARSLASRLHSIVVLKGSGSIIAAPNGRIAINPTGNPGLATGGTGDVLAGVCGALLAQGCPPWESALAAVWMHGAGADYLVEQGIGPIGMTPSELIPAIRHVFNRLIASKKDSAAR